MNRAWDDELLSAYVDGELSAEEKAEVEQRLADDPAARRLVEQLRTVSAGVRALPPRQLGEDLSAAVLRLAERRMLTDVPQQDLPRPIQPNWSETFRRRFLTTRALLWTGAIVAAALLLSNLQTHQQPQPQQMAEAPQPGPKATPSIEPASEKTPPGAALATTPAPAQGRIQAKAVEQKPAAATAEEPLLVKCYLTAAAAKKQVFDRLLMQQKIVRRMDARLTAPALERDPSPPADLTAEGPVNAIYCEVNTTQLEATLAALDAHPESYPAVVVDPAPGAKNQEAWRVYSHGYGQLASASPAVGPTQRLGIKHHVVFAVQMAKLPK
jgi:anti-sigma factor RsiW